MGWIGFDLDGTLAEWGPGTSNPEDVMIIGAPIPAMIDRLKAHLEAGEEVRIFTARVGPAADEECWTNSHYRCPRLWDWQEYQTTLINAWMLEHVGQTLVITATKDFHMLLLYDDRCKQVIPNQGRVVEEVLGEAVALLKEIQDTVEEPI